MATFHTAAAENRFIDYFAGRTDVHAEQLDDGSYRPIQGPLNNEELAAHRLGDHTYGIYTIRPDNRTRLLVWDIDSGEYADAERIIDTLEVLGIGYDQVWVEFSGRKGYHVWCFLEEWTDADIAYRAVRAVLQVAKMEGTEAYPKQSHIFGGKGYGNLIKLPLGQHRQGKRSTAVPQERTWAVRRVSPAQLAALAAEYEEGSEARSQPFSGAAAPNGGYAKQPSCVVRLEALGAPQGMRDHAMYTLALEYKRQGLTQGEAADRCYDANQNFSPPMTSTEVGAKVRSAYTGGKSGVQCSQPFLHSDDGPEGRPLCSKLCPRYKLIPTLPATDDAPPQAAGGGGRAPLPTDVGDSISVTVVSSKRRPDGVLLLELGHPGFEAPAWAALKGDQDA